MPSSMRHLIHKNIISYSGEIVMFLASSACDDSPLSEKFTFANNHSSARSV